MKWGEEMRGKFDEKSRLASICPSEGAEGAGKGDGAAGEGFDLLAAEDGRGAFGGDERDAAYPMG